MSKQSIETLIDNPAYIRCAMQAFEEGARAEVIKQQCQCEMRDSDLAAAPESR